MHGSTMILSGKLIFLTIRYLRMFVLKGQKCRLDAKLYPNREALSINTLIISFFCGVHNNMQKIGDKIVYNTIEEIIDPSLTALVLWDVQRAFTKMIFNKEEFSRNLNSIVESARKSNIPIFFTSHQMLSKRFESSANIYTLGKQGFDRLFEQFTAEDMDFTIKPKQDEIVINKHTASIFIDTGFERMLKNAGIITIVFTGIATEFGVESSARDDFNRGF
ncbi:MAG TPA: isochorismatase family cysteine hydrolase [Nitrososphaeraceae archaeon]|nr:isochorismatase family cysteine hydrolase [Nitrososphaeraceae archaeon]